MRLIVLDDSAVISCAGQDVMVQTDERGARFIDVPDAFVPLLQPHIDAHVLDALKEMPPHEPSIDDAAKPTPRKAKAK